MLRWLKPLDAKHVMFEATDCHHRTLERRLSEACVPFAKVNPCRTRRFAEATGRLAKTMAGAHKRLVGQTADRFPT